LVFSTNIVVRGLGFEVSILNNYSQLFIFEKDLNLKPEETLEARNLYRELNLLGSQRDPSLEHLVDVSVEAIAIALIINVEALVEIESK
jgi:hypothetical protein